MSEMTEQQCNLIREYEGDIGNIVARVDGQKVMVGDLLDTIEALRAKLQELQEGYARVSVRMLEAESKLHSMDCGHLKADQADGYCRRCAELEQVKQDKKKCFQLGRDYISALIKLDHPTFNQYMVEESMDEILAQLQKDVVEAVIAESGEIWTEHLQFHAWEKSIREFTEVKSKETK